MGARFGNGDIERCGIHEIRFKNRCSHVVGDVFRGPKNVSNSRMSQTNISGTKGVPRWMGKQQIYPPCSKTWCLLKCYFRGVYFGDEYFINKKRFPVSVMWASNEWWWPPPRAEAGSKYREEAVAVRSLGVSVHSLVVSVCTPVSGCQCIWQRQCDAFKRNGHRFCFYLVVK